MSPRPYKRRVHRVDDFMPWEVEKFPLAGKPIVPKKVKKPKRERGVQRRGVKYAKAEGWSAYKVRVTGQGGFPDYLFMKLGKRQLWWEFKKQDEKPEPLQERRMLELKMSGVEAGWSDNFDDFRFALDAM